MQILGIFWRLLFWAWFTDFFGHTVPGIEYSKLNKPWQASVVAHVMRSLCSFFHSTWPHNLPTKLFLHWFLLLLLIRHLVLSNFEYMYVCFFSMFRACFRTWRVILLIWCDRCKPRNMMGMALRALEFCLHCLDASPWPFLLEEVLQNYALAVEVQWHITSYDYQRAFSNSLVCYIWLYHLLLFLFMFLVVQHSGAMGITEAAY